MAANNNNNNKARVLILGGCGFVGRHLVKLLVDNKSCSYIKVADKALPATSYLNPEHKAAFDEKDLVKFQQADLTKDVHVEKVFKEDVPFDYVFNVCGETRFALPEDEYKKKIVEVAIKCGTAAATQKVKRWVEVSDARVYSPDKERSKEEGKLDPWTMIAKWRLAAEQELAKMKNLPVVVLRPAIIYGRGDLTGLTPRITCAAVYKMKKEKMKFLWDKDLRLNVVHVDDVVRAMWIAATELKPGTVYNLAEVESNLDQGELNAILGSIFKIETGFLNSIIAGMAKLNLQAVADHANDEHVPGWSKLCHEHNIANTPLSPYIDKELLKHDHLSVDGAKITKESTLQYKHKVSEAEVLDQVQDFIKQKLFPPVL